MGMITSERERTLLLLTELTPGWVKLNRKRTSKLLVSPESSAPCSRCPEPWCHTWEFRPGPYHGEALDVQLLRRKEKERTFLEWTQGSWFHFREGYVVYAHDGMALQIIESQPAEPAKVELLDNWPIEFPPEPDDITRKINEFKENGSDAFLAQRGGKQGRKWVLCRMVKRDPGFVRATVYRPKEGPYRFERIDSIVTSQDRFVRTLIVGLTKA